MPSRAICFAMLALLVGACSPRSARWESVRPRDVGRVLEIPSLTTLDSVRLGMEVVSLESMRPSAQAASWVGKFEVIGADTVYYHFAEGAPRGILDGIQMRYRGPDRDSPLLAVATFTHYPSTAAGDSVWTHRAAALAGSPPAAIVDPGSASCFRFMHGPVPGLGVLARADSLWVGIVSYPQRQERDVNGPYTVYALVRSFLTVDPTIFIPASLERVPIACP